MKFHIGQKCKFIDPNLYRYSITLTSLTNPFGQNWGTADITGEGNYGAHKVFLEKGEKLSITPLITYKVTL